MESQHPAYFVWRYRYLIIGLTLVGLIAGVAVARLVPEKFDTSISFAINRIHQQSTTEYQFDGYYAIQASDLFSQTVLSWFVTPSVLLEIYERAGTDPQVSSIEELTSRFKAKKYSAQNIVIRFHERDRETAEKISTALIEVIEERGSVANTIGEESSLFEVQGATPVIISARPLVWLSGLVGMVSSCILALLIAYTLSFIPARRPTDSV